MEYVGIAINETERLARMDKRGQVSLLADSNITTADAKELCARYGLLSPNYTSGIIRRGCWFCPNAKPQEFAHLRKVHPELFNELRILHDTYKSQLCTQTFRYTMTFEELDRQTSILAGQISIFDLIDV